LHQQHDDYEQYFNAELKKLGFITDDMTYHSKMHPETKHRLSGIYNPTALYIRTRADRVAIHTRYRYVFQWEVKTHDSRQYRNWALEVFPLIVHKINSTTFGIRCLYAYYNPFTGHEAAFWSDNIPILSCIMLTDRLATNGEEYFNKLCKGSFPHTNIITNINSNGSGDPFALIDEGIVKDLPSGIALIEKDLEVFGRNDN